MLNQSFSADNLRRIFDYENRKGVYLEGKFFPDIAEVTSEIKNSTADIKLLKKKKKKEEIDEENYNAEHSVLSEKLKELKDRKEELLSKELEDISSDITSGAHRISLRVIKVPNNKDAFCIDDDPRSYFAVKQVQYNVRKLFKVKQSNRSEILNQLKAVLSDEFPKIVIRTDIEGFYENIPNKNLLQKIDSESLLTLSSKRIIRQITLDYQRLSGNKDGVPRGIGISAYLSELYMRDFDRKINSQNDVIYYARYVDDIVIVYAPKPGGNSSYLDLISKHANSLGLTLKGEKTKELDLRANMQGSFEYLGYKIKINGKNASFEISNKKINKYKKKIDKVFEAYSRDSLRNEKRARQDLVKRVRFLTGNTRLLNSKRNALVGVYFSNRFVSDTAYLNPLDSYMTNKINLLPNIKLKQRLSKMTFREGFVQRRFSSYSIAELSRIVEAWKHEK